MQVNLPPGWREAKVGEICTSIVPGRNKPKKFDGEIPWITTPDIINKYIPTRQHKHFVSKEEISNCGGKKIPIGSVIINCVGDFGITAIAKQDLVINQQLHAFICPDFLNNEFLLYQLQVKKTYMESVASRTTIPYMNKSNCESIPIEFPPIPEQKKIARILSTWDSAIGKLEALIAAKQKRKKALMQQLLTGKKRFKEFKKKGELVKSKFYSFPSDWIEYQLKDFAIEKTIRNDSREQQQVLSCSKYDGFVNSLEYFRKKVFSDDTSNYKVVLKNEFGFPCNHIEEGSIGLLKHVSKGIVSPIYAVFKVDESLINPDYLYSLFKTDTYQHIFRINTNASVDRRGSLRWKEFSLIKVPIPPLAEQEKITFVLSEADKEIELHQKQLEAFKRQKKSLMQQLLTGKKRVTPDPEDFGP